MMNFRNNVIIQPGPQLELPTLKAKVVISFLDELTRLQQTLQQTIQDMSAKAPTAHRPAISPTLSVIDSTSGIIHKL